MRSFFIFLLIISSAILTSFCLQIVEQPLLPLSIADPPSEKLCIGFYNVENLFDTIDDPGIDDAEFLPNGKNQWTREKYHTKINHIAKVVRSMNEGNGVDILGLAEVETWEY
jgi:hypothetical protein